MYFMIDSVIISQSSNHHFHL